MTPAAQAQALFQAYLPRLGAALARAEAALPPAAWRARLAPDMLPLLVQAEVAVNLALRTHAAVGGTEVAWGPAADSPAGVQSRLAHALVVWRQVPDPVVAQCHDRAGDADHDARRLGHATHHSIDWRAGTRRSLPSIKLSSSSSQVLIKESPC